MWVSEGLDGQMGLFDGYYIIILWAWGLMVRVVYMIGLTRQVWTNYLEGGYLRVGGLNV